MCVCSKTYFAGRCENGKFSKCTCTIFVILSKEKVLYIENDTLVDRFSTRDTVRRRVSADFMLLIQCCENIGAAIRESIQVYSLYGLRSFQEVHVCSVAFQAFCNTEKIFLWRIMCERIFSLYKRPHIFSTYSSWHWNAYWTTMPSEKMLCHLLQ